MTSVLPEDGTVSSETCRSDLINDICIYIYPNVCVHLLFMLKI